MNINCHTSELIELFSKGINISTPNHDVWNICIGSRGYVIRLSSITNGQEWNYQILQDTVNAINIRISNIVHVDIEMSKTALLEQKDGKYLYFHSCDEAEKYLRNTAKENGGSIDKTKFSKTLFPDGSEETRITIIKL